jgi:hypothetical protein
VKFFSEKPSYSFFFEETPPTNPLLFLCNPGLPLDILSRASLEKKSSHVRGGRTCPTFG